jgi:hypothetical protein
MSRIVAPFEPKVYIIQTLYVCVNQETKEWADVTCVVSAYTHPALCLEAIQTMTMELDASLELMSHKGLIIPGLEVLHWSEEDITEWCDLTPPLHRGQIPSEV